MSKTKGGVTVLPALVLAGVVLTTGAIAADADSTAWPWTTAPVHKGLNLRGKMFTLTQQSGIVLYSPSFSPSPSPSYSTHPYPSPSYSTSSYPWSTPTPTRGVSMCLRYITEEQYNQHIFTLSPYSGSSRLALSVTSATEYQLTLGEGYYYSTVTFRSLRRFWSTVDPDFWTSVCVIVDSVKGVAQIFNGRYISIRKRLPVKYVWTGPPVVDISQFEGQLTDVQVWDYPLPYGDIRNYMRHGFYRSYQGSALTWFQISYTPNRDVLLEDVYDNLEVQSAGRGDRPLEERRRRRRKFFCEDEKKCREGGRL
ncbi:serum amyloid P-component-like [Lampris incognitus]|uniref:serum amyloid P-component-like n=1 Tax=Lampris incognitus TaxID=2546036 RepID=UPI0024B56A82|nr:serum amyloid P-component-like [Lampris incognitus]